MSLLLQGVVIMMFVLLIHVMSFFPFYCLFASLFPYKSIQCSFNVKQYNLKEFGNDTDG